MTSSQQSINKTNRHREKLRAAGLRPVRFWVSDTRDPQFVAELQRQCLALKEVAAEETILRLTEDFADQTSKLS